MFSKQRNLLKILFSKRPIEVVFHVTYRCNSRCSFCKRWKLANRKEELSLGEIRKIFRDLYSFGVIRAVISGGEPLLRKDIFDILGMLSSMGVKPILNTNGILLNGNNIRELLKIPNISIIVSLDTLQRRVYKSLRRVDGLNLVVKNLKSFKKIAPHMPLRVHMVVTRENYREVDKLISFCRENGFIFSAMPYNFEGRFEDKKESLMYHKELEEVTGIFRRLSGMTGQKHISGLRILYKKAADWVNGRKVGRCNAGYETLYLNMDGRVAPCADLPYFGDLKKDRIKDIYDPSKWEKQVKKCCEKPACFLGCYWGLALIKQNKLSTLRELLNLKKALRIIRGEEY